MMRVRLTNPRLAGPVGIHASQSGFTILELLIVIGIIGLLAGLMLPVLARAKRVSTQTACSQNMRQQYLSQAMYADDHQLRFAKHLDFEPTFHRSARSESANIFDVMAGTYIQNPWITICPGVARAWGKTYPHYKNPFAQDGPDYGGWGSKARNISTSYMWTANFLEVIYLTFEGRFSTNNGFLEPPWPVRLTDCDSTKAFVTHRIATNSTGYSEMNHMPPKRQKVWTPGISEGIGVMMADGSVVFNRGTRIKPRAINTQVEQVYWY